MIPVDGRGEQFCLKSKVRMHCYIRIYDLSTAIKFFVPPARFLIPTSYINFCLIVVDCWDLIVLRRKQSTQSMACSVWSGLKALNTRIYKPLFSVLTERPPFNIVGHAGFESQSTHTNVSILPLFTSSIKSQHILGYNLRGDVIEVF